MEKKKKKKQKHKNLREETTNEKLDKEKTEEQVTEKTEQAVTNNSNNKNKRKRKEVFPFGNYRSYYGYRIGQGMEEDPRFQVFKREWFEGKDCLDIGCNSGIITIHIAKRFHCRKILGIDIDSDRIADAYWHLRKFARAGGAGKSSPKASKMEVTEKINGSEHCATLSSVERKDIANGVHSEDRDLFSIVSFKKENFIQSWCRPEEQYDTILW
ncbi:S-adenosylmethionine-dependent methyltransferase, putative [Ricinus communis]|uniref:RNA methyltransferase n=1 Tax=Ricinus communis TaxID=3988 RepID=B9RKL1_RICCO|nr:S-adenosylmethionine-dependent methyltransferase, putative [Ricinus communis]